MASMQISVPHPTLSDMNPRLPPAPFLRRALVRAAAVWLFLRAAMVIGSTNMRPPVPMPDALLGTPLTAIWITAVTVGAVRLEMGRHRETGFLRNLGVSFVPLALVLGMASLVADLMLRRALG